MTSANRCRSTRKRGSEHASEAAHDRDGHSARGDELIATLQKLVHEGNVRRIFIDDEDGTTLIEIPLLLGIRSGPHMESVCAAAGALSRMASNLTVRVQREQAWPKYND